VDSVDVKQFVGEIEGKNVEGDIKIIDTELSLDIYLPHKARSDITMANFELSEHLIKLCNITDAKTQRFVLPLLQVPLSRIEDFMELHSISA